MRRAVEPGHGVSVEVVPLTSQAQRLDSVDCRTRMVLSVRSVPANLHDSARLGELDGPDVRRILSSEMSASPVIVREVAGQDAAQVPFA